MLNVLTRVSDNSQTSENSNSFSAAIGNMTSRNNDNNGMEKKSSLEGLGLKQAVAKGSKTRPPGSSSSSTSSSPRNNGSNNNNKPNYPQVDNEDILNFQSLKKLIQSNALEQFASPRNNMARWVFINSLCYPSYCSYYS